MSVPLPVHMRVATYDRGNRVSVWLEVKLNGVTHGLRRDFATTDSSGESLELAALKLRELAEFVESLK